MAMDDPDDERLSAAETILTKITLPARYYDVVDETKKDHGTKVLVNIFRKLPVRTLFQIKCVCRKWNRVLHGVEFQAVMSSHVLQYAEVPISLMSVPTRLYLLWDTDTESQPILSFDFESHEWGTFDLFPPENRAILNSEKGLLLMTFISCIGRRLFVVNPLTKMHREITFGTHWIKFEVRQMVVDDASLGHYYIIAEEIQEKGPDGRLKPEIPRLQVYSSIKRTWQMTAGLPKGSKFKNAFAFNGHFLCFVQRPIVFCKTHSAVDLFKLDTRGLELYSLAVPVTLGPGYHQWIPQLFIRGGHLMLAGETSTFKSSCRAGVGVWVLNQSSYKWELLDQYNMPDKWFRTSVGSYRFDYSHDYILVRPNRGEKNKAYLLNLITNSWEVLKRRPHTEPSGASGFIVDGFMFYESRMDSIV